MPSRVITAVSTAGTNTEKKKGEFVSFDSITSDTGPVSNAIATSATLYISSYQTFMPNGWLNVIFGNNSGTIVANTQLLAQNSTSHSSTETLDNLNSDVLLTATVTQMRLGVQGNGSSTASYVNIRNGCTITLTINYEYNTTSAPTAPTLKVNNSSSAYATAGATVSLSWSGASAGTNNAITGYQIWRGSEVLANVNASTTSYTTTSSASAGGSYSYAVVTVGAHSASAASNVVTVYTYSNPTAPTTVTVSNNNPVVEATVTLSWYGAAAGAYNNISGYHIYRATSANGTYSYLAEVTSTATSGLCSVAAPVAMGKSYYYKVYTIGTRSNSVQSAVCSLTASIVDFTDPTLTSRVSEIKAIHMTELQERVNALRTFYGLSKYTFTTITAGQTSLGAWNTHVRQIREAFDALGISHAAWIDVSVNCPTAAIMKQLRDIVMAG